MDNFRINRLDFSKMVDKHMNGHPETKYFNAIQMKPSDSFRADKMKESHGNANIQRKIDFIVAHVYSQLKDQKPTQNVFPLKSKAIKESTKLITNKDPEAQTKLTTSPDKSLISHSSKKENVIFNDSSITKKRRVVIDNPAKKPISIPRLKVLCHRKEQKRLHHTVPPPKDTNNFVNQKMLADIKRQNAVFESMLEDQKQLQRDQQSIASEIFTMRNHLEVIRGRLDNSLKKLEQNKTYGEQRKSVKGNSHKMPTCIARAVKNNAL